MEAALKQYSGFSTPDLIGFRKPVRSLVRLSSVNSVEHKICIAAGFLVMLSVLGVLSGCAATIHPEDRWWAQDKAAHLAAAAIIGGNASLVARQYDTSSSEAVGVGVAVAMCAGVAKEVYDQHIKHSYWSWKDLFWDWIGAIIGSLAGANCCHDDDT